ncbi:MAG TPA: DNA repair protein RecN [Smithellaceae bacterium]|nr:DNA repair protein RecN [Smithellaceae bacterium]
MLHDLSIRNFAIIDELSVSFEKGLNLITGETGAGKSILIGAVSLLLGDRATSEMIRTQADAATVEARFDVSGRPRIRETLENMGFAADEELIVRRVISRTGKNKASINGQMATLANLAAVSESLINICGQHEHQRILDAENHIDILDEFGGCLPALAAYQALYRRWRETVDAVAQLEELKKKGGEKADLLAFQLKELAAIDPKAGEDAALADEKKVLANAQKLAQWSGRAFELLYADADCVLARLKDVQTQIRDIASIDAALDVNPAEVEAAAVSLQETARALRDYNASLVFDPERLAAIDERLDVLHRLKRKYGGSLEAVAQARARMQEELAGIANVDEALESQNELRAALATQLGRAAQELTDKRLSAAEKLKAAVDGEIAELNMPHARFFVKFLRRTNGALEAFGPKGGDEVEFHLAANAGEDPKPLARIASGGELSRIVLALKNALSRTGSVGTMVFDEVDSGIGGATAEIVGRKLKAISADAQVICITHLPQIACFGGRHLRVLKSVRDGRTSTEVEKLDDEQKIYEISRMLGGVELTDTARDHARRMIETAALADSGGNKHVKKSTHR